MQFYDNKHFRPSKSGEYYAITAVGGHYILNYSTKHRMWNVRDDADQFYPENDMTDAVVCWAFCPKTDQALLNMVKRED